MRNTKDEIFQGLVQFGHFKESFMNLNEKEEMNLMMRLEEYKGLLKKTVYVSYIMLNCKTKSVKNVFNVFNTLMHKIVEQKIRYKGKAFKRISDYDNIVSEIIQVFIVKLLVNLQMKYKSSESSDKRDAYYTAKLLCTISKQFLDETKPHFK